MIHSSCYDGSDDLVVLTRKRDASIDCDYVVVSRNGYRSILAESAQYQRCNDSNGVSAC